MAKTDTKPHRSGFCSTGHCDACPQAFSVTRRDAQGSTRKRGRASACVTARTRHAEQEQQGSDRDQKALDHEYEDLADAAHAAAEAYEKVHATREQWIVIARPLRDGPIVTVGSWTTRTQAEKAEKQFVSAHRDSNEGTFSFVTRMYQTSWMQKLEGK